MTGTRTPHDARRAVPGVPPSGPPPPPDHRGRCGHPPDRPDRRQLLRRGLALAGSALLSPLMATALAGREARAQDPESAQGMRFMRIGTGSTAGNYFPVGGLIANAISRPPGSRPCERGGSCGVPGLIAVAQSTGGSVANVQGLAAGTLDLALCQADIAFWARSGTAVFAEAGPMPSLYALARLYDEKAHLVVRDDSPLRTLADLRGTRVALGEEGSGTLVDARLLLAAHGLSEADLDPVYDKPGPAADLLVAGEIDAFFFIGAAPVAVVADLAQTIPIRLLPLDGPEITAMADRHPYLAPSSIPRATYAGVAGAVRTVSVGAVLVTTDSLDEATAHAIARAIWHPNARSLFETVAAGTMIVAPLEAPHGTGIPLHPGAQRYYEEQGYLP